MIVFQLAYLTIQYGGFSISCTSLKNLITKSEGRTLTNGIRSGDNTSNASKYNQYITSNPNP